MSKLVEKIYAECAPNQAPAYVERFFSTNADGKGRVLLTLYAPMGLAGLRTDLEKRVEFSLHEIETGSDMIPTIHLQWEPEGGGPFPTFKGTLTVEAGDDYSDCALALRGEYEPPFGAAGKTFDAAMGRKIAGATARELLERIRDFIEHAYQDTEREKRARAQA
ncbi:MAG TPA: hypothetical protein VN905_03780 [Candidatus Binatia bacterium]|nr:hypothetical protein [Candidatus Binatia bacterium]